MLRFQTPVLVALGAILLLSACPKEVYWEGDGPVLDPLTDTRWENGNLGGEHVIGLVEDILMLSPEEVELVAPYLVSIDGAFGSTGGGACDPSVTWGRDDEGELELTEGELCSCYEECDENGENCQTQFPAVQFGSRAATIVDATSSTIQVLAPPGPVRGGKVDVSVTCWFGRSTLEDAYDYVLGDVTDADHYNDFGELVNDEGEPIRRMEPIFENEYASFTLFYTAAPYSNVPEPAGYGFFFNQPAPRASLFYGGNPGLVYAGGPEDNDLPIPAQIPEVNYEAPEQGDRIRGGEEIFFFRDRDTSNPEEVLTRYARKVPSANPFAPDPYVPEPHGATIQNNVGVWMGIPFDDDQGLERIRYLRVGNDIGRVCNPLNPSNPVPRPDECLPVLPQECTEQIDFGTDYDDAVDVGCPALTSEQKAQADGEWDEDDGDMPYMWAYDLINTAIDEVLSDTRIPVDFRWKWLEPDTPTVEELTELFPHAAPERLQFLTCMEAVDGDGDGYTLLGGDCDDSNKLVYPGRKEACNGADTDCDGLIDETTDCYDDDADGYTEADGDCNDADPTVHPGAADVVDDGLDTDCDGVVDPGFTDADGDGFAAETDDCDDTDDDVHPGADEDDNGQDDDCDSLIDEGTNSVDDDGDGFSEDDGDCNDGDPAMNPGEADPVLGANEEGDGLDNDCDGEVDPRSDYGDLGKATWNCEAETGIGLPDGTYEDAFICRSFDEDDDFPWWSPAVAPTEPYCCYCMVLESLPEVTIEQGSRYVQVPQIAQGSWALDDENLYYDGIVDGLANAVGENVLGRGTPTFISYGEGYYRGDLVPAKNPDMQIPEVIPPPMGFTCGDPDDPYDVSREDGCDGSDDRLSNYDDTPYITIPPVELDTFYPAFGSLDEAPNDLRVWFGFPALLPMPGEEPIDWRIALPGGADAEAGEAMDRDGWSDTYFILSLDVIDIARPGGLDSASVWSAKAFAWAGDDYINFSAETLSTLPAVGHVDALELDGETQNGENLLGLARLQVHRTANWIIGEDFRDASGRAIFDINTDWNYYFTNQNSCYDGIDNDGDGFCDIEGCRDENDEYMPPDAACACEVENPQDLNARYECPVLETAPCSDGDDNDEDGLIDADDPDCYDGSGQYDANDVDEGPTCSDGVDNDGDGWTDYPSDPGCTTGGGSDEGGYSYLSDCNDSIDNDADGRIDAQDPGCDDAGGSEDGDTCGDGIDNNDDGWIDLDDVTCAPGSDYPDGEWLYSAAASMAFECSSYSIVNTPDGFVPMPIDDDGDGLANTEDPECLYGWDPSGEAVLPDECHDRIDNDGDGWIDDEDAQCAGFPELESEGFPSTGNCDDNEDNDLDGWIDELDPDCMTASDDEIYITGLACNNQVDDDGDGDIDSQDADCPTGKDNHEDQ